MLIRAPARHEVVALNRDTGKIEERIPIAGAPVTFSCTGAHVFVGDSDCSGISVLAGPQLALVKRIPTHADVAGILATSSRLFVDSILNSSLTADSAITFKPLYRSSFEYPTDSLALRIREACGLDSRPESSSAGLIFLDPSTGRILGRQPEPWVVVLAASKEGKFLMGTSYGDAVLELG